MFCHPRTKLFGAGQAPDAEVAEKKEKNLTSNIELSTSNFEEFRVASQAFYFRAGKNFTAETAKVTERKEENNKKEDT